MILELQEILFHFEMITQSCFSQCVDSGLSFELSADILHSSNAILMTCDNYYVLYHLVERIIFLSFCRTASSSPSIVVGQTVTKEYKVFIVI